jgi:hypothetical protein
MNWRFWKKNQSEEEFVPYIPQGRLGYKRLNLNNIWYFTIIVEKIGEIGNRCKIKVIEVDVDRDCNKTKTQCLHKWGGGDWVDTSYFIWESEEQRFLRRGTPYMVPEEILEPEEIEYKLTPHNFN